MSGFIQELDSVIFVMISEVEGGLVINTFRDALTVAAFHKNFVTKYPETRGKHTIQMSFPIAIKKPETLQNQPPRNPNSLLFEDLIQTPWTDPKSQDGWTGQRLNSEK